MKFKVYDEDRKKIGGPEGKASPTQYGDLRQATRLPMELLRACPFVYRNDESPYNMWASAGSLKGGREPSESGYLSQQVAGSKLTAIIIPVLKKITSIKNIIVIPYDGKKISINIKLKKYTNWNKIRIYRNNIKPIIIITLHFIRRPHTIYFIL